MSDLTGTTPPEETIPLPGETVVEEAASEQIVPTVGLEDLAFQLQTVTDTQSKLRLRSCTVEVIGTGDLTIKIADQDAAVIPNIPYLDSYSPFVGDNCWAAQWNDQLLVLGGRSTYGAGVPAGTVVDHWGDVAPAGWLLCYGQAITSANTTYPALWANSPAAAKSGTTLTLPDLRGRVTVGVDNMGGSDSGRVSAPNTVGSTGGSESHTSLIAHTHDLQNHTHGASGLSVSSHNHDLANHTHTWSDSGSVSGTTDGVGGHTHGGATNSAGGHDHTGNMVSGSGGCESGPYTVATTWGGSTSYVGDHVHGISTDNQGAHSHGFSGSVSVSGTTNTPSNNTSGSASPGVSGNTSTPSNNNTGNAGSGSSVNHMPPYFILNKIIKV